MGGVCTASRWSQPRGPLSGFLLLSCAWTHRYNTHLKVVGHLQGGPLLVISSYEWSSNPYKWPYKWVTGVITPLLLGVIIPFITGWGPPCSKLPQFFLISTTRNLSFLTPQRYNTKLCESCHDHAPGMDTYLPHVQFLQRSKAAPGYVKSPFIMESVTWI